MRNPDDADRNEEPGDPGSNPRNPHEQAPDIRAPASDLRSRLSAEALKFAERSKRVGRAIALFDSIVLPYPRQIEIMIQLDELRLAGIEKKKTRRPQNGLRVEAVSRSGKSVGAEQYRDHVNSQPGRDPKLMPVLIVPLEELGTSRSFFADGLAVLGDGFSTAGTEEKLKARFKDAIEELGVELLIVDEVNHLCKRHSFGRDVADSLKRFLDDGVVPVAFFGTEEAAELFARSKQLSGRLGAPYKLPPLQWHIDYDRELFLGFVEHLDDAMVEKGVLRKKAGLAQEGVAELLCEASNGIIGQLCCIVKEAVREAVRRDADTFDVEDLALAVDDWSIGNGFRENNPFRLPTNDE
jgi:hypothetical protein